MDFRLIGFGQEDMACFDELAGMLGFTRSEEGVALTLIQGEGPGCFFDRSEAAVTYRSRHEIWRELGLLKENLNTGAAFEIREKPAYRELGVMLDCSRNGVLTVAAVKDIIRHLALMGYASVQLYTEDTYQIEGEPYFGYQRGAYSREELRELDAYAGLFDIELIPCIQTLAHLEAVLHWKEYEKIRDFGDILMAGAEQTYALIDKMFAQMSDSIKSRRINIGMDEAHMLGLGKYLDVHGYENRMDIMLCHYKRVVELAHKYGYHPMMWSDMFFRLAAHGDYYSDEEIFMDESVRKNMDEDVTLVYWDYYTMEEECYDRMFRNHKKITQQIAFAGGAWKWEGPCPNSWYSRALAPVAHRSCKKNGVEQVVVTAWGDNGDECSLYAVLPAFAQWAELCYADECGDAYMERRFRTCTGASYEAFLHLGDASVPPDNQAPGRCSVNPVRYLLYQDVLGGLFDTHVDTAQQEYLAKCAEVMETSVKNAPDKWKYLFATQAAINSFLSRKCMLGVNIRAAYAQKDRNALKSYADMAAALAEELNRVIAAVEEQWLKENKIFGLDIQQLQLGGLKQRLFFAAKRLEQYCAGMTDCLDELEAPPLPYYGFAEGGGSMQSPPWRQIVSACKI